LGVEERDEHIFQTGEDRPQPDVRVSFARQGEPDGGERCCGVTDRDVKRFAEHLDPPDFRKTGKERSHGFGRRPPDLQEGSGQTRP
jgi:hypothetical protein